MKRTKKTARALALVLAASVCAPGVEAGILGKFKELLDQSEVVMNNFNGNMWTNGDSLGNSAIQGGKDIFKAKGIKGKYDAFNGAFDKVVAAQVKVQDSALTDVKAFLKILADIILWLPRKLQELFKKAMDAVRAFMAKLGAMNQGATVSERWGNLVSGGAGGAAAEAAFRGGAVDGGDDLSGGMDMGGDDLADALDLESVDAEAHASVDAPAAPRASNEQLPSIQGSFTAMIGSARKIEDASKRKAALIGLRKTWIGCLDLAFERDSREGATKLFKEATAVYRTGSTGMHKAVGGLADKYGSKLSKDFEKASKRLHQSIKLHQ